jgi:FixJ family two-component response regulator
VNKVNYVFVIDDDPSARNGISRLLRAAGYTVIEFSYADEFLEFVKPDMLGCIVLDIRMPGLSGYDLMKELKKRGIDLPVIVVTGDDDPKTRSEADSMNAVGFFRKPVDGIALLDAIDWTLRSNLNNKNQTNK